MSRNQTTALDIIYKLIIEDNPGAIGYTFKGFTPEKDGLVREITENDGTARGTFSDGVAVDVTTIEIGLRGLPQDYATPRNEAVKLRRLICRTQDITVEDINLMYSEPQGNIMSLGRDAKQRAMFSIRFNVYTQQLPE